jgi:(1->4)-alpha-D-glucan 1-alpha-D-glucosylmutase
LALVELDRGRDVTSDRPKPPGPAAIPRATYRLQLNAAFPFDAALAMLAHLQALGISHLYASPLLKARPGSNHGYDVIDPSLLNPEIGDEAGFSQLTEAMTAHGLQLLLDIVPNHMGVLEADNPWWLDVLENGPAARHAAAFDIEWSPPQHELRGKLLLPVLGRGCGQVLEAGEIEPRFDPARGQFMLHYFTHRFPIDPADHAELLQLVELPAELSDTDRAQMQSLIDGFARLPPRDTPEAVGRATRQREAAALKTALAALHAQAAWAPAWLDACAARLCGEAGQPESFDRLDALLQRQAYRLAHWRAAGDELNYRRFFDIDGLAGLRVEDPAVFEAAHERIFAWIALGRIAGLRIDHPDGMTDPEGYFQRLAQRCAELRAGAGQPPGGTYLLAEKILADDEAWPRDWPLHGETGYRFSNQVNGLFVDGAQAHAFDELVERVTGAPADFDAELDAAKRGIMGISLAADLRLLTELAHDIALGDRHSRDLTREGLRAAIVAMAASFEVYRSYVSPRGVSAADHARIEKCAAAARARCRPSQAVYVDFVRQLMLYAPDEADPARRAVKLRFVQRLQQFTAPVMAKAMEDTAFYRYHRLVSLNDVGGDPRRFGMSVADFHAATLARQRETPHTMLGTSTHDSKRSEDVRARLDVLSEMPQRWSDTLQRWRELARTQWRIAGLDGVPAPNDELLLYQTLLGIWPTDLADDEALADVRERVCAYMRKAVREAKQHSSWLEENDDYEQGLTRCIELLLARLEPNPFLSDLRRFAAEIAPFGCLNSLAMVAIKLTAPGVPDIYQGCEDWRFMLVDPDNRRPVDPARLQQRLAQAMDIAQRADAAHTWRTQPLPGGIHKLFVTWRLLQWRREAEALFRDGEYRPLDVEGERAHHVVAFARAGQGGEASITVVPRLVGTLTGWDVDRLAGDGVWGDTAVVLPEDLAAAGRWQDVLAVGSARLQHTGGYIGPASRLRLAEFMTRMPMGVLRTQRPA